MDYSKAHQGQNRQDISPDEAEEQAASGLKPGVSPDLHAPSISHDGAAPEINLHGDVPGSPYSSTPGEISLTEAAEAERAAMADPDQAAEDDADTREREVGSRRTGVPTEQLAAEDEAGDDPEPTPKRPARK